MSRKVTLPNGVVAEEAEYKEQFISEYNINPLIQALPQIKTKEEVIKILNHNTKISKKEIEADEFVRLQLLQKIYKVFQPLPIHLKVWNIINTLIMQGYVDRNPFNPKYRRHINKLGNNIINQDFSMNVNSNYVTTASCGLIIGFSGMGKTTIVNKVLENIPQVICHSRYNNTDFSNIQVTWIKLEAPHNASLKALTLQFFMKVDELVGTENMKRYAVKNLSVDAMLPIMGQLANNIGLGLLIIDELQHMNKNTKQIMNYLVALMNTFGVPILLIGTPACYDMLQQEMRIARRVTGGGEVIWNKMKNDKEFRLFIKGIWKYQYLKNPIKLTEEIINTFYEKTQGISDLVVKLFISVQKVVIERDIKQVDEKLIEKIWNKEFKLLNPILNTIESNNKARMFKYEDIKILEPELIKKEDVKVNKKITNIEKEVNSSKKENRSKNKIRISQLEDDDVRKIVLTGMKQGKNNYQSLLDSGLIVSVEDIIGGENL